MTALRPDVTVQLQDVAVNYRVYEDSAGGLKEHFSRGRVRRRYQTVRALRGVTLEVHESETLGVIGANGSGKSTLLSAMTGLLPLKSGTVRGRSRPALLGVSSALRSALSGRRNVLIGGLALGFTRDEIESRMDEIIEFAGLSDAVDRPMRTYSSGMRARLHFAIATARIPEILLIDEALAVGDAEFRARSSQRIDEICAEAGSVVVVSHNMTEIEHLCDRVAWLDDGEVKAVGEPGSVVASYLEACSRTGHHS